VDSELRERVLWIRGTLGVGKTIMAGHFIELLKCLYPNAIVAYFFCRSGQPGLTRAHDIIRTLCYQCIQGDIKIRSVLECLRGNDFTIDSSLGVGFLFEKLLQEPLSHTKNEVFIILDGLDEADWKILDTTERPPQPEMEIFLEHLGNLLSSHLLFIGRPEADIPRFIPNSITKTQQNRQQGRY
jgi:NACHT domain